MKDQEKEKMEDNAMGAQLFFLSFALMGLGLLLIMNWSQPVLSAIALGFGSILNFKATGTL